MRPFALVTGWLVVCAVGFVVLASKRATSDIAVFVPIMVALQIPVAIALFGAPEGQRLSALRCVGIAIPAAIVGGFQGFFTFGSVAVALLGNAPDEAFLLLAFGSAGAACVGAGVGTGLYLPRRSHPLGVRRVMTAFCIAGVIGGAILMTVVLRREVANGVLMTLSLGWALPFLVWSWRTPVEPAAPSVRVVR